MIGVTMVAIKAPVLPHAAENPLIVDRTSAAKSSDGMTKVLVVAPKRLIARMNTTIVNFSTELRLVSRVQTMATMQNVSAFNAKPQSCKSYRASKPQELKSTKENKL